jgi:phosphotransferase system  glucose/maltose/N-acetylglucosamine-specific IIC component
VCEQNCCARVYIQSALWCALVPAGLHHIFYLNMQLPCNQLQQRCFGPQNEPLHSDCSRLFMYMCYMSNADSTTVCRGHQKPTTPGILHTIADAMQNLASSKIWPGGAFNHKLQPCALAACEQLCVANTSFSIRDRKKINPWVMRQLLQGILQASHAGSTAKQHTAAPARR